jgi:propanol-preferring alcohol dehydrogenase
MGRAFGSAATHALDASLIFAPVGALVPLALSATVKGGCDLRRHPHERYPRLPYRLLWGERSVRSVANLTREDGTAFCAVAAHPVHCERRVLP